ncbi:unnamed protein product (macronuclear) [Paramecium tetraurelia]|uniref:Uncharacterized protein n=1 Tax=Paramecium tetraurelia TaxID=5888 RepID=A0C5K7_PARTE|nr:uncharacterized protein GSPATT00035203001 [Paramecium tetraurelia]CAK66074.1 unnamed protein product [Paramecium tetraurelia]|eukprot:XP_001433471.1 hypothetical protein (macronuclear) [Paramecium tetraurelia strain d4-2]
MNSNPPPVIILYRQSLNDPEKKNFSKLWQQEPIEVKEFFSNLFQALKYSKDGMAHTIFELETSDSHSEISEINWKNQGFISEQSNSMQELLNILEIEKLPIQSAFLENNSINSIAYDIIQKVRQLCERMKTLNINEELSHKINDSFLKIQKLRK